MSRAIETSASAAGLSARHWIVVAVAVGGLIALAFAAPIAQPQAYHRFADDRSLWGVANIWNVASNLPFLAVGLLGLVGVWRRPRTASRPAWLTFFAGVVLVCFGSAYYHWTPDDGRLVWDRLPMTLGFMGLFVALLGEWISPRVVKPLLPVALALGLASVWVWYETGDLRLYVWVQAVPLVTIPLIMALFRAPYTHATHLLMALVLYLAAKATEHWDAAIYEATGEVISGHALKHLLAAMAVWWVAAMLANRVPRGGADSA